MEVVRIAPLTVPELVEAGADLLRPDRRADARPTPPVPVPLGRVVELRCEKVDLAHGGSLTGTTPQSFSQATARTGEPLEPGTGSGSAEK